MGKNNKYNNVPAEENLILPEHSTTNSVSVVDTHTHLFATYSFYKSKYKQGKHQDAQSFARAMYEGKNVEAIVDVYCEAPVVKGWKGLADSALTEEERNEKWGGLEYWFVMGVHPHDAKSYNDAVEADILKAMDHPRCVGWGEIGLDYHYDNSPRDIQQEVFTRQLRQAVRLNKPLTIHTREAEEDTERIMKAEVPKDWKIHIHCFTDSPEFAQRMLDHYPNLYIGVTGVITYSSNVNTSNVIRSMASKPDPLRIVLETDAPYMVPANIYDTLRPAGLKGKLPLSHTAMIPWTADFVAGVAGELWNSARVMRDAREAARAVYGV